MTNYRIILIKRMEAVYGANSDIVVQFTELCEDSRFTDSQLGVLAYLHEKFPKK